MAGPEIARTVAEGGATEAFVPTPETLRRVEKDERFLRWLYPRLAGSAHEIETTIVMLMAHLSDRYAEGIHDAAEVAQGVSDFRPQSREAHGIAKALAELERRHRADAITSLDDPDPVARARVGGG